MGSLRLGLILLISFSAVWAASPAKKDTSSPLLNAVLCPLRAEPWACVRQQASRMLVQLDEQLNIKSQELKAQADAELEKKLEARGFSATEIDPREKPSSVMQTMEDTLDSLTDGVEALISNRGSEAPDEEEEEVELEGEEKKKKMKKKKKKPSSNHQHDHEEEEEDDHDWEVLEEHNVGHRKKHGHKHGQDQQDVLIPVEDATVVHEDANAEKEVEAGRFAGELRGKKKKKKKAIMKLLVLGAVMKGKVEMLLKILSFHLQLKFFAIAVLGLLINLARFWVDVKKSHHPQKVIYYEHAQHQHHYDEGHGEDGWGGYWKRSLNVAEPSTEDDTYYSTNHYNNQPVPSSAAAYSAQRPAAAAYQGASELAYNRQVPHTRYV